MKIDILASGSGGNCIAVRSDSATVLIDAGIAKTKIEKRLLEADIRADQIDAIFITHAHKDHVKGLPLANKYRIPVYAGEDEWKNIDGVDDELRNNLSGSNEATDFQTEDGFTHVVPFKIHHDAYDPVGYVIESYQSGRDEKVSICLDTGKVDPVMLQAMEDSDTYIIEANHDVDMLEASEYPESVKARILSDIGHLSNEQAAEALQKLVQGRGERIYLTHLSQTNNMPALAELVVKQVLKQNGFQAGKHYHLEVV